MKRAKAAAIPAQDEAIGWAMALFALATIAAVILAITTVPKWMHRPLPVAISTVKLSFAQGHGSGVHIGNQLILTAAHVAAGQKAIAVKTSDGQSADAEVLWVSKEYDVALVRLSRPLKMASSPLSCADPQAGLPVTALGNPGPDEFVIMRGHVAASGAERFEIKSMMVLDMTVGPGMSGGPVFDADGNVVGIVNALMSFQTGPMSVSLLPIAYSVPGKTLCMLLGRA